MCIFYGDKKDLTYKGQEHIFPAAIGGKEKLPKGYVSDQANNFFSYKFEQETIRCSMVSRARIFQGPGKRGTDKLGEVQIQIMENPKSEYCLGYFFKSKPYLIPQVNYNFETGEMYVKIGEKEGAEFIEKFWASLSEFKINDNFIRIKKEHIPTNKIIIGCYQDKFFVASDNQEITSDDVFYYIEKIFNIKKTIIRQEKKRENHSAQLFAKESCNDSRLYLKIAFNVIAKFKGKDYLSNEAFDNAKKFLIGEYDIDVNLYWAPQKNNSTIEYLDDSHEHYCVIYNNQGAIWTKVNLYGWERCFKIAFSFDNSFITPLGFFCNYEQKCEYILEGNELYKKLTQEI